MATNEILKFAGTDTGTNLLTQAEYAADLQRETGNQSGIARSKLVNKSLRQASTIAAGTAEFLADNQATDITDDMTASEVAGCFQTIIDDASTAVNVSYDNDASGLSADNVQDAIDEVVIEDVTLEGVKTFTNPPIIPYLPEGAGAVATTVQDKLRETISVKDFGAVGNGVTDDTAAIQAAVDYACQFAGNVYLPPGDYILSDTIVSQPPIESHPCAKLIGAGVDITTLTATHSNGPVVTIRGFFSGVTNLTIDANATRKSGAAGTNYGILHHPPDTASGQAKFAVYEQIEIRNQPSHAVVFCATWVGSRLNEFEINNCGGHGIVIDDGTILSRTNRIRCGGIDIVNGQINDCVGHAILAGDDQNPGINEAYRINIQNIDIFRCATSAGVRLEPYACWLFMRNSTVTLCAIGGFVGSPFVPTIGGIWVAGESITLNNNRFVTVLDTAISINRKLSSQSVIINEITILGTNQPVLSPAILINSGVENVAIQQQSGTNIGTLSNNLPINSYSVFKGVFTTTASMQAKNLQPSTGFKTGNYIVLSDDNVETLDFTDSARGVLVVSGNTSLAQAAVIHFRVGTFESATILSATGNVDVTTGVLTGTTGVDGKLTISVATDNKIYFENRLGYEFSWQLTLLSLAGPGVLT